MSSDFQTPRRVEYNKLRGVLKSEEIVTSVLTYVLNVFCEKIKKKADLMYVISTSDFQTFSTMLVSFVLAS